MMRVLFFPWKRFLASLLLALMPLAAARSALVWSAGEGWKLQGGALVPLAANAIAKESDAVESAGAPEEVPEIAEMLKNMNKARRLQDEESYFRALGYYNDVVDAYRDLIDVYGVSFHVKGGITSFGKFPLSDPVFEFSPTTRLTARGTFGKEASRVLVHQNSILEIVAEAYYQRGIIYHKRSQFEKAYDSFQELIQHHPEYHRYGEVVERQYAVASAIKNGERPYLWGWIPWFTDSSRGLRYFEGVNRNAPYGPNAVRALLDKGMLALELDKRADAIDAFERIISNYPDSGFVPDAYLSLALAYERDVAGADWDQGSTRNALDIYTDFVQLYPAHPRAGEAVEAARRMRTTLAQNRLNIGLFYYEHRNNPRAAAIFFNEAINAAPDSEPAVEARKHLAVIRSRKPASRDVMDWIFGRFPLTPEGEYVVPPPPPKLEDMGFAAPSGESK